MKNYLSFGGGVNSVALHLLLLEQGEDFESVFVHHGTDWPETYQYVAGFQWWLKANRHKPVTVLRPEVEGIQDLYNYCWLKERVPSFMARWCTDKFKIRALHKYYQKPAFEMLGIDAGETNRAKLRTNKGIETRWPLIEQDVDRDGCIEIIKRHGLPIPPKSGCYICPFQRKQQWIELRKKHPCLFQAAVDLEKRNMEYRESKSKKPFYLTMQKCSLPQLVQENQGVLFEEYEYPPCQCGL